MSKEIITDMTWKTNIRITFFPTIYSKPRICQPESLQAIFIGNIFSIAKYDIYHIIRNVFI